MPWLNRDRYRSLLRAAHDRLFAAGKNDMTFGLSRTGMLLWRLAGGRQPRDDEFFEKPFEFIATHDTDTHTFVFIVHNGEALVIKEPLMMFPSDQLVAQLRLLL